MQEKVQAQSQQLWDEVELSKAGKGKWVYIGTGTWRQSVTETYWRRTTINFNASYVHKSISLMSNIATFYTKEENTNILEIRPWQGVAYKYPDWDRMEIVNFLRFEERFLRQNKSWSFSPRIRYELSTRIALTQRKLEDNALYFYGAVEFLNNFNKPLEERFSNSRTIGFGLGFIFSKDSSVEMIYELDQRENTLEANILENETEILRFRWLYVL